jgi:hypothetical protein
VIVNYTVNDTYALLKEAVSHTHPNVKRIIIIMLILILRRRHW